MEHKYNPISFLNELRSILKLNGTLVIRVPNYNNIYKFIVGRDFLKYDFRESHNFYFSKNNLDIMFDNSGFLVKKALGFNEYNFNHLLNFAKNKKRIYSKKLKLFFNKKNDSYVVKNIEKNHVSTSLIYILKKK